MKKILLILVLTGFCGSTAMAAEMFTGRFKPQQNNCNNGMEEADRVYATITPEYGGSKIMLLQFQAYGSDARIYDVLLDRGSRQAPGTSVEIHGVVTQEWTATISGNVLSSAVTVKRPSMNYVMRTKTTVTDYGTFLEILEMPDNEFCRLVRY